MRDSRRNTYCGHTLGCTREFLLIALDSDISPSDQLRFDSVIGRRAAGEPSAYITGHKEFYGLDFKVDPRALIPRPETELLVELALEFAAKTYKPGRGSEHRRGWCGVRGYRYRAGGESIGGEGYCYGHLTSGAETGKRERIQARSRRPCNAAGGRLATNRFPGQSTSWSRTRLTYPRHNSPPFPGRSGTTSRESPWTEERMAWRSSSS